MRQGEPGPEAVSEVVQRAIEVRRPKDRYLVAFPFTGRLLMLLGDSVWDKLVRKLFKIREASISK